MESENRFPRTSRIFYAVVAGLIVAASAFGIIKATTSEGGLAGEYMRQMQNNPYTGEVAPLFEISAEPFTNTDMSTLAGSITLGALT